MDEFSKKYLGGAETLLDYFERTAASVPEDQVPTFAKMIPVCKRYIEAIKAEGDLQEELCATLANDVEALRDPDGPSGIWDFYHQASYWLANRPK